MKAVQNVIPAKEPVTIAVKETVSREELRFSRVRKDGKEKIDLRLWDVAEDGSATPHTGGFCLNMEQAKKLRDALNEIV